MIKERPKNKTKKKSVLKIILEYLRTAFVSFIAALLFTVLLSVHARSEMIKNLYKYAQEIIKMDEQLAKQIVSQSDLISSLENKKYVVCMHVGNLYETAKDYPKAQQAYEYAVSKAPPNSYFAYYKLIKVIIEQEHFKEADEIINYVTDTKSKNLVNFKTQAYIAEGNKYYSIGKFLSAAKAYEKAKYYYGRFTKRNAFKEDILTKKIVNSYIKAADIVVKNGFNSDAVRYLKKAEKLMPDDFDIRYKLAVIYADLDPEKSTEYFDKLLQERPQDIDYTTYNRALMKSANIADLENRLTKGKYYRYKIHSNDLFIKNKVIYKNDIKVILTSFQAKKAFFKYYVKSSYKFQNSSGSDIYNLSADFILKHNDRKFDSVTVKFVGKNDPLLSDGLESKNVEVQFKKGIFTKKELNQYRVEIYLYKDEKYKTLVASFPVSAYSDNILNKFLNDFFYDVNKL